MGALILGVILIIGYYYQSSHPYERLKLARSSGYHIYFKAGSSGFIFVLLAFFIWLLIDYQDIPSWFIEKYFSTNKPTFVTNELERWSELKAFLIFFMAFTICLLYIGISKLRINKLKTYNKVKAIANDLELLIINSTLAVNPIRIELENGKVYVGLSETPDLEQGEVNYITMLPLLSGYVDETKKIIFNNNYYRHYEEFFPEKETVVDSSNNEIDAFSIVLPVDQIVVASNFNIDAFIAFRNAKPSVLVGPVKPD